MMPPTMGEDVAGVAEIALRLTKAQRAMVLTDDRGFATHARGKWHGIRVTTARKLHRLGLIEQADTLATPTDLGLAVRAYLEANP